MALSSFAGVPNSIPQGSILSHLHFIIFINDRPVFLHGACMMFADSAKLLFKTDGVKDLQVDLVCLSSWVEEVGS